MIIIVGGGIAGLCMALTCEQLGLPCKVFEATPEIRPLGVGINLQPNAVRELFDLGLQDTLATVGIEAQEWALFTKNAQEVWSEPRGLGAGYRWPQYSIHRGELQMLLLQAVYERLGPEQVQTDARLVSYRQTTDPVQRDNTAGAAGAIEATFVSQAGEILTVKGDLLIGADGIHSTVRAQMYPDEGEPLWCGTTMWRGTARAKPPRTHNSFILIGTLDHRFVCYPISKSDSQGYLTLNWIAELTPTRVEQPAPSDWNRQVAKEKFLHHFEDWNFEWINVPGILEAAETVYEYPMVDRNPVPDWVDGRALILGDAAHAMYPVGSNGASRAIVDTRLLGAQLQRHGATPIALRAYQAPIIQDINALILRNRGAGPISILGVVEARRERANQSVDEIISKTEVAAHMSDYKKAAGFAVEALNASPPTLSF